MYRGMMPDAFLDGPVALERRFPEIGIYLWVMEANAGARRFYERLGARAHDTIRKSDPRGATAPNCAWDSPASLLSSVGP